jgi:hypothetical protein
MQRSADLDDQYISPLQLAQEYGLHYNTVLAIFRQNDFPSVKIHGRWRVRRRSAYKYFQEKTDGKERRV